MHGLLASLFGKERLIGLDIGSAFIKVVQVDAGNRTIRNIRALLRPTPQGAVRDGIVVDRKRVGEAIRQMLREADISATGAITAISGPTVMVRQIRLPRMSEASVRKSIRYEAGKYITASIEDSVIEFEILGASLEQPDQMDVMLVAAPREMVDSRTEAVEAAGLEAVAVDLEAFALQRALVENSAEEVGPNSLRALVHLGAAATEVILLTGRQFALTRSIAISGDALTTVVQNHYGCEPQQADANKRAADMSVLLQPDSDPEQAAVPNLLQPTLDELLREIRRSIHYYMSQMPADRQEQPLDEIILSGGSAQLGGIAPYMERRLGVTVRLGETLSARSIEPGSADGDLVAYPGQFGVAVGLALKETSVLEARLRGKAAAAEASPVAPVTAAAA